MKVLVDRQTGLLKGAYKAPIQFSISGFYIMDVPDVLDLQNLPTDTTSLINAKIAAFKQLHPTYQAFANDEMIASSGIDVTKSTRCQIGRHKRMAIRPGGVLMTNTFTLSAPPTTTAKMYIYYSLFTYYYDVGPATNTTFKPSRLLYNYDPNSGLFPEPAQSNFTVNLMDSTGVSVLATPIHDSEITFVATLPQTYRLRFTNNGSSTYYLSDWTLFVA